jgi:hypothetical protein
MTFLNRIVITVSALMLAMILSACDYLLPKGVCDCWPSPAPHGGFSGMVHGCGDFWLARQSSDSLSILHVRSLLSHPDHFRDTTYEISLGAGAPVVVSIERFDRPQILYSQVCDDVGGDDLPVEVDTVTSGTMRLRAHSHLPTVGINRNFRLDATLLHLKVGERPVLEKLDLDSVAVGWLAG